jgi:siroheme synthase
MWMKVKTTKQGPISSKAKLTESWKEHWRDLPQERIQDWVKRIMRHVQEAVRLKGGNEYKEGNLKGQEKNRVH